MELHNVTNWIDKDILEKINIKDFSRKDIDKIYEINVDKVYQKFGEDDTILFHNFLGQPIFLTGLYRAFILTNSKGLQFLVCTFDRENKIDWGVGYYIYQKDKEQDFTYHRKKSRFKITFPYADCKQAYEIFNKLP